MINACLDIYLEQLSAGNYGLHNLKHDLSLKYGPTNYFKDDELFDEITKLTFPEVRSFFAKYVEGNESLPYENFFGIVGVKFIPKREITTFTMGGVSIRPDEQGKPLVAGVGRINEFGKKMGYKTGDVLLSLNGEELSAMNFLALTNKFLDNAKEGDTVTVKVNRKGEEITLSAPAAKITKTEEYVLELDNTATAEQLKLRNAWLNITCSK